MTNEDVITKWISLSDEDLDVAEVMLKTKHYLYVVFMCQQSIEKIFKGYYQKLHADTPLFTHSLLLLAEKNDFIRLLTSDQITQLETIEKFYINTRYPDTKAAMSATLSENICSEILNQTKIIQSWTKNQISLI